MRNQCRPESADSEPSFVNVRPLLSLDTVVCDFPPIKRPLHADAVLHAFEVSAVGARRSVLVLEKGQSNLENHSTWWTGSVKASGLSAKHAVTSINGEHYTATLAHLAGEIALEAPGKLRDVSDEWLANTLVKANTAKSEAAQVGLSPCFQPSLATASWLYGEYRVSTFALQNLTDIGRQGTEACSAKTYVKLMYWLIAGLDLFSESDIEPSLLSKWAPGISMRTAEILRASLTRDTDVDFSTLIAELTKETNTSAIPKSQEPPPIPGTAKAGLGRIAGMRSLTHNLMTQIVAARKDTAVFQDYGLQPVSSLLLIGPSGCGKTLVARCLAEELGYLTIQVRPSDVASVYVRETVVRLREYFDEAIKNAPCVLFFDEFHGLVPDRDSLVGPHDYKIEEVNEILTQLEVAKQNGVFVIAASNQPFGMDPGVFRAGRFDQILYVAAPDEDDRLDLLKFYIQGRPTVADLDLSEVAARLDGYSASDVKSVVEEAARMAMLLGRAPISAAMLFEALSRISPSITRDCEKRFQKFITRGFH